MKKLQMKDLTPAILTEVSKLGEPKKVVDFFAEKGFEVTEEGAQKILSRISKDERALDLDELEHVSGGCGDGGSSGTTQS